MRRIPRTSYPPFAPEIEVKAAELCTLMGRGSVGDNNYRLLVKRVKEDTHFLSEDSHRVVDIAVKNFVDRTMKQDDGAKKIEALVKGGSEAIYNSVLTDVTKEIQTAHAFGSGYYAPSPKQGKGR